MGCSNYLTEAKHLLDGLRCTAHAWRGIKRSTRSALYKVARNHRSKKSSCQARDLFRYRAQVDCGRNLRFFQNGETRHMTTSLVTGGAGFMGSHVAEHLVELGHRVIVVDDLSGGFRDNVPAGAEFVEGSILDHRLIDHLFEQHSFDYVYHL